MYLFFDSIPAADSHHSHVAQKQPNHGGSRERRTAPEVPEMFFFKKKKNAKKKKSEREGWGGGGVIFRVGRRGTGWGLYGLRLIARQAAVSQSIL